MESIQFPALGLEFSVNPVLAEFTVFGIPFSIRWYGLLIAVGFLLAVLYAAKTAKKAYKENISLKEACVALGFLTAEKFDEVFRPEEMAYPQK